MATIRSRDDADLVSCVGVQRDVHETTGREGLKTAQPVVDAVVATFFADHVPGEELRRASRILDRLADANRNDDGFDCGL